MEMPGLISPSEFKGAEIHEDSALLTFLLPKIYNVEELIDEIEDQMELVLLYHHIPTRDAFFGQKCCAYSNPDFGRMYKVNSCADDRFRCDTLYVTLYESLETMGSELLDEMSKLKKYGEFKFCLEEEKLLRNFF